MQATFLVTLNVDEDDTDILHDLADNILEELNYSGFDVESAKPWKRGDTTIED